MNTRRKGYERELEYLKMKEKQGYTCFKPSKTKFNKQDIFGMFDILCMNKKDILLIQVKSNQKRNMSVQKNWTNHPSNCLKILAVKKDRKDWKEFIIK